MMNYFLSQVFVLLQNTKTNQEVIFIAEPDATSLYKFEVDLHAAEKEQFGSESGKYSVQLIVGDAAISNPVLWNVVSWSLGYLIGIMLGLLIGNLYCIVHCTTISST